MNTGRMFVNHATWTTPDLPFGCIKNSGYEREISSVGIQASVNKKLVPVASINAPASASLFSRRGNQCRAARRVVESSPPCGENVHRFQRKKKQKNVKDAIRTYPADRTG